MSLSQRDLDDLQYAKELLENPSLGAKISNVIGFPIERGFDLLPAKWSETVSRITKESLEKALDFGIWTMSTTSLSRPPQGGSLPIK